MRSGTNCTINCGQVHSWALELLADAKLVKDHGWKCTVAIVLGITLRAAARCISVSAACRDLAKAPSDQAVMTALVIIIPAHCNSNDERHGLPANSVWLVNAWA